MRTLLLVLSVSLLPVLPLYGELAAQPLETVVWESELIVVGKVTAVSEHGTEKSYATANVLETWKGAPQESVEFLAEPTWACALTEAFVGETVVLFLIRGEQSRSYLIDGSGGGRLPVQVVGDIAFASSLGYPILPDGIETMRATNDSEYPRLVRLHTLREAVEAMLRVLPVPTNENH
jgi:hypothetical protein